MGLLPRLLIAEALVFALVFAGGVLLIIQMANSLRDNIRQERLLLGRAIAEDLDSVINHSVTELEELGSVYLDELSREGLAELQGTLDFLAAESAGMFTRGILVLGPNQTVVATNDDQSALMGMDLTGHLPDLLSLGRGNSEVLTSTFTLEGQAMPSVAIAVPLGDRGSAGYVVGLVDPLDSYPSEIVDRAVRIGGSGHADIIEEEGAIALFTSDPEHLLRTSDHPASYLELFVTNEPVTRELPHEHEEGGKPHLMAFVPLESVPWALSVGTTVSEAYAPVRQLWYGGLAFLTLLMGLAFGATVFVGRKLVQPVRALSVAASSVAEGDRAGAVRIPWGGEIGELAGSLESMRRRLQAWGSELEMQVQARTSELEERNRELRVLYETLLQKEEQLHSLLGKVLGAQEDERKRVSRELHDGIGQALSALHMGLERLEQTRPEQLPRMQPDVEALKDLAGDSLRDLRRLTIALRPAALDDLGLVPAIRRYVELYLGDAGTEFQVHAEGLESRLDPAVETVIYRIVQEAINNVARHGEATQVEVHLQSIDGTLAVTVEDNGRGFDPSLAASKHGMGLAGMEERASLAGAKFTVDSQPGRGTKIHLEIPWQKG